MDESRSIAQRLRADFGRRQLPHPENLCFERTLVGLWELSNLQEDFRVYSDEKFYRMGI